MRRPYNFSYQISTLRKSLLISSKNLLIKKYYLMGFRILRRIFKDWYVPILLYNFNQTPTQFIKSVVFLSLNQSEISWPGIWKF